MKALSIILHDWSVRERFHTLDWLSAQTVPRDQYEIIWVECYTRELEDVRAKVDELITLGQEGLYHKHKAMNAGLAVAQGRIVTLCDSDAVYPPDFVASVLNSFTERKVLMHAEHRSHLSYPTGMSLGQIKQMPFFEGPPNVGACASMLRRDAIGFGGVDEHESYRGLICGHNELVWRLINSGVPEVWHDSVFLYHFKHPGSDGGPESTHEWNGAVHDSMHNLTGVDAFREGRLLPLAESPEIHRLRMNQRSIGTDLEKHYSIYHPEDVRAV